MTSIFAPTEAVSRLAKLKDWTVVMVGDKKTPKNWYHDNVIYLSPEKQRGLNYEIIKYLPWNLPARVMVGYLYAIEHGAEIITQIDDDNIPNEKWDIDMFDGNYSTIRKNGFVNIYQYFTDKFIWPRGYPLNKILEKNKPKATKEKIQVGVWQHLADKEPDVDAIYRLTNNSPIIFKKRKPLVLAPGTICPFNCQSTTFRKEVFLLLYLPAFISPRESDIVRGLIAQPILWSKKYTVGFTNAKVTQERNPHNYLKDFEAELLIYRHSETIITSAQKVMSSKKQLDDNIRKVYTLLIKNKLIPAAELNLLNAWLKDIKRLVY